MPDSKSASTGKRWVFDLSPVCHPLWWVALGLLLINDNLLKGHGVVPSWLTGKLSDFAFLVVAPVLLCALLPLALRARRPLALAAIATVFTVTDLWPAASDAVVALAGRVGLHWRLWPDVTDLLALLVLPLAWRIAGARAEHRHYPARRVVQPAGVTLGALACLATGSPGTNRHYPFLVNQTTSTSTVEVTWLLRKVDCSADLTSVAATLSMADLDDTHQVNLSSGQVTALDLPPTSTESMGGICQRSTSTTYGDPKSCTAMVVSVPNGPAVLVSALRHWLVDNAQGMPLSCSSPESTQSMCESPIGLNEDAGTDALALIESGGTLRFKAGSKLQMVPVDWAVVRARTAISPGCRDHLAQMYETLDGARSCVSDADCQVVHAAYAIPAKGICNVYVNRSLSFATVLGLRETWNKECAVDDRFQCNQGAQVQPATCRAGRCEELCPNQALPSCPQTCAARGRIRGALCEDFSGNACLADNGDYCTCVSRTALLTCRPQSELFPGCPIACVSDLPVGGGSGAVDAGGYETGAPDRPRAIPDSAPDSESVDSEP